MAENKLLVFIGNSHLQALRAAAVSKTSIANALPDVRWIFIPIDARNKWTSPLIVTDAKGEEKINQAIGYALEKEGFFNRDVQRVFISALSGNIHNAMGLIEQRQKFDVIIPGRSDLPVARDARIVPIEQFLAYFRKQYEPFFNFFSLAARHAKPDQLIWLEPPSPIESNEHITKNMDQWFKENYSKEDLRPSPPLLRYKLWLLNRMVLQEGASERLWTFLTVPSSTQDETGYRVRQAWNNDATHGSAWYGEEVLKNVWLQLGKFVEGVNK